MNLNMIKPHREPEGAELAQLFKTETPKNRPMMVVLREDQHKYLDHVAKCLGAKTRGSKGMKSRIIRKALDEFIEKYGYPKFKTRLAK
jgi:hypothetical protein